MSEQDGKRLVSPKELHAFLELKERFHKWFDRMTEYGFEESIDYTPYQMVHPQKKQEQLNYSTIFTINKHGHIHLKRLTLFLIFIILLSVFICVLIHY